LVGGVGVNVGRRGFAVVEVLVLYLDLSLEVPKY